MTPQTYRDPEARKRDGAGNFQMLRRQPDNPEASGSLRVFQVETLRRRYAIPTGLASTIADLHFHGRGG